MIEYLWGGGGNIIKYGYVPGTQLGFFTTKDSKHREKFDEIKLAINGLVTIYNVWLYKNHGCYKFACCKILILAVLIPIYPLQGPEVLLREQDFSLSIFIFAALLLWPPCHRQTFQALPFCAGVIIFFIFSDAN